MPADDHKVVCMSVKDAIKELKRFKVEYSGSGEFIYEGEIIRLLLD